MSNSDFSSNPLTSSEDLESPSSISNTNNLSTGKDFTTWSVKETAEWLKSIGCTEEITAKFIDEEIDGEALQSMANEERLMTIGVKKMGVRLKISNKIHALLKANSTGEHQVKLISIASHGNVAQAEAPTTAVSLTSSGKISQAGQAYLKAHHPWALLSIGKRLIKTTARHLFSPTQNFRDVNIEQAKKLEDAVQELLPKCSLPQLGFGAGGIRSHLLDTMREYRRRNHAISKRPKTAEETSKPRALTVRNTDTEERQDGAHSFDSFEGVDWDRGCALSAETTPMPKPPPCLNIRKRPAAASAHASRSPGADVAFHHQFGRGERTKRHSFESAGLTARQEDSDTDTDLDENVDLSQRSSNAVVAAVLKAPNISMALMDRHLRPMAKLLGISRYASKDKNWLVVELARHLVAKKWVTITGDKRNLYSNDIVVKRYF